MGVGWNTAHGSRSAESVEQQGLTFKQPYQEGGHTQGYHYTHCN